MRAPTTAGVGDGACDQRGVTLIELLLVIAITGIIMAPLAAVMINGLDNSARTHERLIDNGAAQRIAEAWTKDVQSVDPTGVDMAPVQGGCSDLTATSPPASLELVSFNWDLDAGSGHLPKTATWALVDHGGSTSLVRRYCEDGFRSENILARNLGVLGLATAHGPNPGTPEVFCPADLHGVGRTCALVIPDLNMDLTVTRRVPDYHANTLPTAAPPPPAIYAHDARYQYLNIRFRRSEPQPVTSYEVRLRKGSPTAAVLMTRTVTVTDPAQVNYQVSFGTIAGDPPLDVQAVGDPPVNYYVTAVAINDVGSGIESDAYGPMNPQPTGPDVPGTPTATLLANGCVRVAWSPNAIDGGSPRTSFRVWAYAAPTGAEPFVDGVTTLIDMDPIPGESATPPATTYDFCAGLSSFDRYRFVVADKNAVDIGEISAPSEAVMVYAPGTRFVTTAGSDSANNCTTATSPCKTIGRAVDVSAAGDAVAVAKGNYSRFVINGRSPQIVGGFDDGFTELTELTASTAEADTTRVTAGAQLSPAPPAVASTNTAISVRATSGPVVIRNLAVRQTDVSASTSTSGIEVHSSGALVNLDTVRIVGGNSSNNPTGLLASGSAQVAVAGSWIDSGSPDGGAKGSSAYGVRALDGAAVNLSATQVDAASGVEGAPGGNGNAGTPGCGDHDGANSGGTGSPGNGGSTCGGGTGGREGGAGGKGAKNSGDNGSGGSTGGQGSSAGSGGTGNSSCGGDANGGGGGGRGHGGAAGANGSVGSFTVGALWTGAEGSAGTAGTAGTGASGGGGGGSGKNNKFLWWGCNENRPGGGGGSGGQGGAGGAGGAGGTAGGGSFGVYAYDATVVVGPDSTVSAANGGAGGAGGKGGVGGNGGNGGKGGSGLTDEGGAGGGGGGGGGGGAGGSGAGGQGGPAVAVFFARSGGNASPAPSIDGSASVSRGSGGASGAGGADVTGGSGGAKGSKGTTNNNDGTGASDGVAGTNGGGVSAAASGSAGDACRVLDLTKPAGSRCTA